MKKSTARKALEAALAEATTPELKADIAAKLGALLDREGRERARKQRARRNKPAKPTPKVDDSLEPFVLDEYPAHVNSIPAKIDFLDAHRARLEAEQPQQATAIEEPAPAVEPEPERPTGWTRTLHVFEFPSEYEIFPTAAYHDTLTYVDPLAHLGTACIDHDEYTNENGWNSERQQREADAEADYWDDYFSKIGR